MDSRNGVFSVRTVRLIFSFSHCQRRSFSHPCHRGTATSITSVCPFQFSFFSTEPNGNYLRQALRPGPAGLRGVQKTNHGLQTYHRRRDLWSLDVGFPSQFPGQIDFLPIIRKIDVNFPCFFLLLDLKYIQHIMYLFYLEIFTFRWKINNEGRRRFCWCISLVRHRKDSLTKEHGQLLYRVILTM